MRKVQTSILLEPTEFDRLARTSEETGKSKSMLIREALSAFLKANVLLNDNLATLRERSRDATDDFSAASHAEKEVR
jgi:predicted transcriptional regulator